jgi:hypothetical protein
MSDLSDTLRKRIASRQETEEELPDVVDQVLGDLAEMESGGEMDDHEYFPEDEPERDLTIEEAFEAMANEQEMFNAYQDAHQEGFMALLTPGPQDNPYPQDEFLSEAWEEGLQDAFHEAEVVRVVMAAKALVEAETDEAVDAAVQEIKASLAEFTEIEALEEFWDQVTSDG